MPKSSPQISLDWREENYGSIAAVAAFRNYAGTQGWSDHALKRFHACIKRTGFAFHDGRCSYIARTGEGIERKRALCNELDRAGFTIIEGDVRTRFACDRCGSPDVAADASAVWGHASQQWILHQVFPDEGVCPACEDTVKLRQIPFRQGAGPCQNP